MCIRDREVFDAYDNGTLNEIFGTGTAAVISPVGELLWEGRTIKINNGEIGPVSHLVYDTITGCLLYTSSLKKTR